MAGPLAGVKSSGALFWAKKNNAPRGLPRPINSHQISRRSARFCGVEAMLIGTCARENPTSFRVPHTLHFKSLALRGGMLAMRNVGAAWLHLALIILFMSQSALATEACDAQSTKGDLCRCELSNLHPTQASVGMTEVWIKAEKLRDELHRAANGNFLSIC